MFFLFWSAKSVCFMNVMHATISAKTRYRFVFIPIYFVAGHVLFRFVLYSFTYTGVLHDFHIRLKKNTLVELRLLTIL